MGKMEVFSMDGKRRNHRRGRRKSSACRTVLMWLAMLGMCAEPFAVVKAGEDTGKSVELHNPVVVMNECDTVYFGSYWQEDTNGDGVADQNDEKMPIRWRILSQDGDDAYVIADKILDVRPKGSSLSSIQTWLNETFYQNAFSEEMASLEPNEDEPVDGINLAAYSDILNAEYGFQPDQSLGNNQASAGQITAYAAGGVLRQDNQSTSYLYRDGQWFHLWCLRSDNSSSLCSVDIDGRANMGRSARDIGVRPAMHLNLSSPLVTPGGKLGFSEKRVEWDTVEFGTYGGKPIVWRVLEVKDQTAFLLSDQILDSRRYNDSTSGAIWKDSTLRAWLNGEFYETAFSEDERAGIVQSAHPDSEGSGKIYDYVTLLSFDESVTKEYGLPCYYDASRIANNLNGTVDEWGLRSDTSSRAVVHTRGNVDNASSSIVGVRPAICISLSSCSPVTTGSVTADATGTAYSDKQITTEAPTTEQPTTTTEQPTTTTEQPTTTTEQPTTTTEQRTTTTEQPTTITEQPTTTTEQPTTTTEQPTTTTQQGTTGTTEKKTTAEEHGVKEEGTSSEEQGGADSSKTGEKSIASPRIEEDGTVTWDRVQFGTYEQEAVFEKEPIKWRVLSVNEDGTDAFLVADKALDSKPYNEIGQEKTGIDDDGKSFTYTDYSCTWETSSLRTWLNDADHGFMHDAFSPEEQLLIKTSEVVDRGNPVFEAVGGNNTMDKVYLLSIEEASENDAYGFPYGRLVSAGEKPGRVAELTDYARLNGATGSWWLRSIGDFEKYAACVLENGNLYARGEGTNRQRMAVRPVIHVNNIYSDWIKNAGRVNSNGVITENELGQYANPVIFEEDVTWDCVYFGNYYQNANYQRSPLEWRVLSVQENDVFLLADKAIDAKILDDLSNRASGGSEDESKDASYTWKDSSLRLWLNDDENGFIHNAFTEEERKCLTASSVSDTDHSIDGDGDKVFLMSVEELADKQYGLFDNLLRQAEYTDFAYIKGADLYSGDLPEGYTNGYCDWFLRSVWEDDSSNQDAKAVDESGSLSRCSIQFDTVGVRPVMHVKLQDAVGLASFQKLEAVSAKGKNLQELAIEEAKNVDELISDIGTVTVDSKAEVESARKAYDQLSEDAKAKVTGLSVLKEAEKRIAELEENSSSEKDSTESQSGQTENPTTSGGNESQADTTEGKTTSGGNESQTGTTEDKTISGGNESRSGTTEAQNPPGGEDLMGHTHSLVFVPAKAATCTENGYFPYYICSICGRWFQDAAGTEEITDINSMTIPLYGHEWGEWTVTKPATCEEAGVEARVCVHDSSHREEQFIPALGHDWGDWTVVVKPTEKTAGVEQRICKNDATHIETKSIAPLSATVVTKKETIYVQTEVVEIGTEIEVDGMLYRVTSLDKHTVECRGLKSGLTAAAVRIYNNIEINNNKYKITSIAKGAFKGQKSIKKITFGSNIQTVGEAAFQGCSGKLALNLKNDKKLSYVGKKAFSGLSEKNLTCPSGKATAYKKLFRGSSKAAVQISGSGIYLIANSKKREVTYLGCTNSSVKSLSIPKTVKLKGVAYKVTVVGEGAFQNYKKLKTLTIGENVVRIQKNALTGCDGLRKLDIESVKIKSIQKSVLKKKNVDLLDVTVAQKKVESKYLKMLNDSLWKTAK